VDRDGDRWPFEPGGMGRMDGVLLEDDERKLMFNSEEEQWMPAKPCPF
jgi:hypothetical protein